MGKKDGIGDDPRFTHVAKDPKFRRIYKKHVKMLVDNRFQSMFTDKKFQTGCLVDSKGRPLKSDNITNYYEVYESEEESSDGIEDEKAKDSRDEIYDTEDIDVSVNEDTNESDDDDDDDEDDDILEPEQSKKLRPAVKDIKKEKNEMEYEAVEEQKSDLKIKDDKKDKKPSREVLKTELKRKLRDSKIDYARGEGKLLSESSSEEEEVSDSEGSEIDVHDWGELDNDADTTNEVTSRLAICNMDWDRIKAVDLMVLFHSFLPSGGLIHSITIYPSEYGTQQMKEEEENGPSELKDLVAESEDEEMDREQMEKLRKYQLNRLKYYYAVMVCDSKETANALYMECDGLEYECSAVKLDLRFIPDGTTFDQEAKDTSTSLPDLSTYKPRLFQTTALTRSKVDLTWDENDPDREEIVRSVHSGKIDEDHLRPYLAYSSSDEDENDGNEVLLREAGDEKPEVEQPPLEKYKALLADIEAKENKKKNDDVNLEVTWNLKLENKANEIVKETIKSKENLTPFEQYLEKKKEKKNKKRAERKAAMEEEEELQKASEETPFSDDDVPSDVDLNDPYFKEELGHIKKKSSKKGKKIKVEEVSETEEDKQKRAELELLMMDSDGDDNHFNLKNVAENESGKGKKSKKGKKRKMIKSEPEDDFEVDVNDDRFSALYTSHHYNIDPTHSQFRHTKSTKELLLEKLRRRAMENRMENFRSTGYEESDPKAELKMLVRALRKRARDMKEAAHSSRQLFLGSDKF